LNAATGAILWKTYTVPSGYYGGSIWGSTPAVNLTRNEVYVTSGNNWAVPQSVLTCLSAGGSPSACLSLDDHFDSILALDLSSGAINWADAGLPYDNWNVGCGLSVPGFAIPPNNNCPNPKGPDSDFGQGPILLATGNGNTNNTLVGAGQKSGMYWAFKSKSNKPAWATQVAPPGLTGGWAAIARSNGKVLWTTKAPAGSRAEAPVSVANGVVFGCNLDPANGTMYALDAGSGTPLWSYNTGAPCNAGASIANGVVYWGSGTSGGAAPHKVFAFSVN